MQCSISTARPSLFIVAGAFATAVKAADLAIVDARIYSSPPAAPMEHATILIHDGRIVAVGAKPSIKVPAGAMSSTGVERWSPPALE